MPALAAETRYTVVFGGNKAGIQTTNVTADGTREVAYEFTDRGRGPKLTARIKVNEAGPADLRPDQRQRLFESAREGNVHARSGRGALAERCGERREEAAQRRRSISACKASPKKRALLANALLKADGQKLALLPEGQATLRRGDEVTLKSTSGSRRVVSYEISGLGFSPETVWLDQNGAFFASVSSWASFILEGWESSAPEQLLGAAKQARQRAHPGERDVRSTRQPKGPLAIVNANLFDSQTGKSIPGSTVLVEGNRIKAVGADGKVAIPANAETNRRARPCAAAGPGGHARVISARTKAYSTWRPA